MRSELDPHDRHAKRLLMISIRRSKLLPAYRVRHEEQGPAVGEEAKKIRERKIIRELRSLGCHVERLPAPSSSPA